MTVGSVAKCANPQCKHVFRRLGEGKLFVRALRKADGASRLQQKAAWLCDKCCDSFDLRFDNKNNTFNLVHRHRAA